MRHLCIHIYGTNNAEWASLFENNLFGIEQELHTSVSMHCSLFYTFLTWLFLYIFSSSQTSVFEHRIFRTAHARGKAEAASAAAQKAQEECRLARINAKEFSPSFQHRGNQHSKFNHPSLEAKNNQDFKPFDSTTELYS